MRMIHFIQTGYITAQVWAIPWESSNETIPPTQSRASAVHYLDSSKFKTFRRSLCDVVWLVSASHSFRVRFPLQPHTVQWNGGVFFVRCTTLPHGIMANGCQLLVGCKAAIDINVIPLTLVTHKNQIVHRFRIFRLSSATTRCHSSALWTLRATCDSTRFLIASTAGGKNATQKKIESQ